jgi:hypothetical protein
VPNYKSFLGTEAERKHVRRPGWTDNILNFFFFSEVQKLEQRVKKCIELRGACVVYTPSLVAVAVFLPGRAKDLSAPLSKFPSIFGWSRFQPPPSFVLKG